MKDVRKEIRDKVKATKDAATGVGTTGASRLRSDAAAAKTVEIANGLDSDEDESDDEEWAPSSVTASCKEYITVTRLVGDESYRVNKGRMSSLTLHHIYDHQTGESQLVQIQSVRWDRSERVWKTQHCRVYSTDQALLAAEQEDDKEVVFREGTSDEKVLIQRGRRYLRDVLRDSDRLHHIGDVHITSQPVYIIGVAAWLPATALICDAAQLAKRKDELRTELVKHCGLKANEAQRLAADPIYVGEHFSEARAVELTEASHSSDSDSSDTVSDSEEQSAGRADALVLGPSRRPLRRLREKIASGKPVTFVDGLQDVDDDDVPLIGKTSPKAVSISKEPVSDDSADLDEPLKRPKISVAGSGAPTGCGVGAVKVGRGAMARRQEHGRAGAEDVAEAGGMGRGRGRGRGRGGRGGGYGGEVPAPAGDGSSVEERVALPGRGRACKKSALPR